MDIVFTKPWKRAGVCKLLKYFKERSSDKEIARINDVRIW